MASCSSSSAEEKPISVPAGWKRYVLNGRVVYVSPSEFRLYSLGEVACYLQTEGTCKCGLQCPLVLTRAFDFRPNVPSRPCTPGPSRNSLCKHAPAQRKVSEPKKKRGQRRFESALVSQLLAQRDRSGRNAATLQQKVLQSCPPDNSSHAMFMAKQKQEQVYTDRVPPLPFSPNFAPVPDESNLAPFLYPPFQQDSFPRQKAPQKKRTKINKMNSVLDRGPPCPNIDVRQIPSEHHRPPMETFGYPGSSFSTHLNKAFVPGQQQSFFDGSKCQDVSHNPFMPCQNVNRNFQDLNSPYPFSQDRMVLTNNKLMHSQVTCNVQYNPRLPTNNEGFIHQSRENKASPCFDGSLKVPVSSEVPIYNPPPTSTMMTVSNPSTVTNMNFATNNINLVPNNLNIAPNCINISPNGVTVSPMTPNGVNVLQNSMNITPNPMNIAPSPMNGINVTQNPLNISQNGINVPQNPINISQSGINLNHNPMNITQNGMSLQQHPMNITQNGLAISQNGINIAQNPMNISPNGQMNVAQGGMNIAHNPLSIAQNSMSITQNPMNIAQNGMNVTQNQMSIAQNSMNVTQNGINLLNGGQPFFNVSTASNVINIPVSYTQQQTLYNGGDTPGGFLQDDGMLQMLGSRAQVVQQVNVLPGNAGGPLLLAPTRTITMLPNPQIHPQPLIQSFIVTQAHKKPEEEGSATDLKADTTVQVMVNNEGGQMPMGVNSPMPPMSVPNVTSVTTTVTQMIPAIGIAPQILGQPVQPMVQVINTMPFNNVIVPPFVQPFNCLQSTAPAPGQYVLPQGCLPPSIAAPLQPPGAVNCNPNPPMTPNNVSCSPVMPPSSPVVRGGDECGVASSSSEVRSASPAVVRKRARDGKRKAGSQTVASMLQNSSAASHHKTQQLIQQQQQAELQHHHHQQLVAAQQQQAAMTVTVRPMVNYSSPPQLLALIQPFPQLAVLQQQDTMSSAFGGAMVPSQPPVAQSLSATRPSSVSSRCSIGVQSEQTSPDSTRLKTEGCGGESSREWWPDPLNLSAAVRAVVQEQADSNDSMPGVEEPDSVSESPLMQDVASQGTERSFHEGDVVWGQVRGCPSWPGKLTHTDGNKLWVRWFGAGGGPTLVDAHQLKTLSEGLEAHHRARKRHRRGRKVNMQLELAIQEAMMELDGAAR